jgi:hypothetical protein
MGVSARLVVFHDERQSPLLETVKTLVLAHQIDVDWEMLRV